MEDKIIIANLLEQDEHQASVDYKELISGPILELNEETIAGFYHNRKSSVEVGAEIPSRELHSKVRLKSRQKASILTRLLGAHLLGRDEDRFTTLTSKERASVELGETLLVVDEVFAGNHEVCLNGRNLFPSIDCCFPNSEITSTQFLQVSCPSLKEADTLFNINGDDTYDHIDIVSGICIFHGRLLNASLSDAQHGVNPSLLNTGATLSELDFIIRSSSAIADIYSMLLLRIKQRQSGMRATIGLDIPSFHYYHSVIDLCRTGECKIEKALEWIDAVDSRHDQIASVFTAMIEHKIKQNWSLGLVEIYTSSKRNFVACSVRKSLRNGRLPSLEGTLEDLDKEPDGLWRYFFAHVPSKQCPWNWEQLGYLFYVFEVVRSALVETVTIGTRGARYRNPAGSGVASPPMKCSRAKPRRLIFSVDDAAERRIYSTAQEVLKKIRSSTTRMSTTTLMELYLCRKIFVNGNKARSRLFHHEPTQFHTISPFVETTEYGNANEETPFYPLDTVRRVYGATDVHYVQRLLTQAGLFEYVN